MVSELCFGVFFVAELLIRIGARTWSWEFIRDVWNMIDAMCVLGTLADIIIVPVITAVVPKAERTETELTVLRTLRLFKLLRILRLSRASRDVNMFFSGVLDGIREAAIVWAILIGMVFVFSMMLRTYAHSEVRAHSFSS